MLGLKKTKAGSARHGRGDGDDFLVGVRELRQSFTHQFRVGGRGRWCRLTALDRIFSQPVEFVRLRDGRLVALAFLGQNMEQDRLVLSLQKLEGADEQRNVMAIDRAVITEAEFFE